MGLAKVYSRVQGAMDAPLITLEVHLARGLPGWHLVGLPEAAVRESRDRVRSALQNTHFAFPQSKVVINLAPADLPKEGSRFDLPIALAILVASGQLPADCLNRHECYGELALDGSLRAVKQLFPSLLQGSRAKHIMVVPQANLAETQLLENSEVITASHLVALTEALQKKPQPIASPSPPPVTDAATAPMIPDFADIRGQQRAKRALMIAATGRHNLLFSGPPGAGKSLLAHAYPGLLPRMAQAQALESASVRALAGEEIDPTSWRQVPFRSPHHSSSAVALVGGSSPPQPGEISLAHQGVLFLDELPEFDRKVLEVMREPMEQHCIHIARAAHRVSYPADFQLLTAMNPCPCGHWGDPDHACRCSETQIQRYRSRLSGPFLDRLDLFLDVPRVPAATLHDTASASPSSSDLRMQIQQAHAFRQQRGQAVPNARLNLQHTRLHCALDHELKDFFLAACEQLKLSARASHRLLRVARSIADLTARTTLQRSDLEEALSFRQPA